jgi:hypothetical protein
MTHQPIREIEDGVVWYHEGETDAKTKHEGKIEVYPNWVRLGGLMINSWVPRERVEQVHES